MTSKEGVEEMELKEVVVAVFVLFLIVALLLVWLSRVEH